jgi:predicted acylesterase/phospholipase RssA
MDKHYKLDELIICAGGIKAIYIIGCLNNLNQIHPLELFNYYTGCSSGSIICLLLNIGYTIDDIENIISIDFKTFQEVKITNLINYGGFDNGIKINNLFKAFLLNRNYDINITFKELYEKTNKVLTFTTTNITSGKVEYHNHITQPNMQILLSLRMSINIPIVYSPIQYNNNYYVDGALLDCYPYNYNKNLKKIGIFLINRNEYLFLKNKDSVFVNNIDDTITYLKNLLSIMYLNNLKNNLKRKNKNTINIITDSNIELYDFNLDENNKKKMINLGKVSFNKYFKKIYLIRRKRFLMNKYYYLWKGKSLLK